MGQTINPLTPTQLADITRFLEIIRELGGYGIIELVVKDNEVRFVNLKEVKKLTENKR